MKKNIILFIILLLSVFSCKHKSSEKGFSAIPIDSLKIEYAEGFKIIYYSDYKEIIVENPWKAGEVYARYYLVKNKDIETPSDGQKIVIPLQTVATTSVTHFEFLSLLGELQKVTGICSPELIYNAELHQNFEDGKIVNLGDAFKINVERTLLLQPNAVIMSGFNQDDSYSKRVLQAGVTVIYNNEWMEKSLLARAEWIKFMAVFFDKEKQADSIFSEIADKYNYVKTLANNVENKPKVMTGNDFRGTWYVPSGANFMGKLLVDAGADYVFINDTTTSGSIPLNFETALRNFSDADIWLNCNFDKISELINADKKNSLFNPAKRGEVYNTNKRKLPSGANDFWESAIARPDLLLSDFISVLHPEILPNYETVYIEKLK
jgi:ABC-type Fe3+-hydroxamate transport system, periplasmic component